MSETRGPGITEAVIVTKDTDGGDYAITIDRPRGSNATLTRGVEAPRTLPLPRRSLGDLLAEELRRMDNDMVYAESLAKTTGVKVAADPKSRVLVWRDPALAPA
jgi:glucose-6-phosphate dehydrogenase assembly protein OpcA